MIRRGREDREPSPGGYEPLKMTKEACVGIMEPSRKFAKGLILSVVVVLSGVLFSGVWKGVKLKEHRELSQTVPQGEVPDAEMKLTDMEYTEMKEGHKRWTLKASEAEYFQEDRKTLLTSVNLVFFLDKGREIRLKSQKGILFAGTKDIELWGEIRAEVPNGYSLNTERASYLHQQETVVSETPIRISGPDLQLRGMQWRYVIPDQRAFLEGKVEAVLSAGP